MTAQLILTLRDNGFDVKGAIDNKLIAFGMLKLAEEAIAKYHDQKAGSIVAASPQDAARLLPPT